MPKSTREDRMSAVTEPGAGNVSRKADTVDDLLEGFGPERADLPRVPKRKDSTPLPDPPPQRGAGELPSTEPGARQRQRMILLAVLVGFLLVAVIGIAVVKATAR